MLTQIHQVSTTPPVCVERSLSYHLSCGRYYLAQKEEVTSLAQQEKKSIAQAWKNYKEQHLADNATFIEHCLKIFQQWNKFSCALPEELSGIKFPAYLKLAAVFDLIKVPADGLSQCRERLNDWVIQGYLLSKDMSMSAKSFHLKHKQYPDHSEFNKVNQ